MKRLLLIFALLGVCASAHAWPWSHGIEPLAPARGVPKPPLNPVLDLKAATELTPTTWYIRHDGGNSTQCTGTTNAAYPGSGSGIACAFDHPFELLNQSDGSWNIISGDIVQFADPVTNTTKYFLGEQNNGIGTDWSSRLPTICPAPNTDGLTCILPPFPDGVSILGQSAGGACHNATHTGLVWDALDHGGRYPTVLSGINDAFTVFNMQGSQNVTIKCIEITQPDVCTLSGAAGNNITNTTAAGGVFTYSWTASSGNPPLLNQRVTITGTSNGGGIFNVTNQNITSVTGSTSGTFTVAGIGTVSSASDSGLMVPTGKCTQANNYARTALTFEFATAQGPSNFDLEDFAAVGMASRGVYGSQINRLSSDVSTASDIYLFGNGFTGWDADGGGCGTSCETVGTLNITNLDVEWSGTVAVGGIPVRDANTFDLGFTQNYGGQGDNIVQIAAGSMHFNVVNSTAKYGLQDGFDFLHLSDDVTTNPVISITGSWSEGNLGQTIKLGAGPSITAINNVSISNCAAMVVATTPPYSLNPLGWNAGVHSADVCRASGDQWSFQVKNGTVVTVQNNTTTGYGATPYDFGCAFLAPSCGTTVVIKFTNNITKGYTNPITGQLAAGFIFNSGSGPDMFANAGSILDHNLWNTMRTGYGCGGGNQPPEETNCTSSDPLLVGETDINAINPNLQSGSPAIMNGTTPCASTDYNGNGQTSPCTQGAFVLAGTPTAAVPATSLPAGTYIGARTTILSTTTSGGIICYTLDGSTPTATTPGTCLHGTSITGSGSVAIPSSLVINALATAVGFLNSSIASYAYGITTPPPVNITGHGIITMKGTISVH